MQQTTVPELMAFAKERMEDLNEIHIVAVLSKMAYLDKGRLDGKGVSSIMRSSTRLKFIPSNQFMIILYLILANQFMISIQNQAMEVVEQFKAQDVISFWQAFANWRIQPEEELMEALENQLSSTISQLQKNQMVSTALWALNELDYDLSPQLLNALYERKVSLPERRLSERIIKAPTPSEALRIATQNMQMLSGRDVTTCINTISKIAPNCLKDQTLSEDDYDNFDIILSLLPRVIPRLDAGGCVILFTSLSRLGVHLDDFEGALEAWKSLATFSHDLLSRPSSAPLSSSSAPSSSAASEAAAAMITTEDGSLEIVSSAAATGTTEQQKEEGKEQDDDNDDIEQQQLEVVEMIQIIRDFRDSLQRTCSDSVDSFGPQSVSRILWAFAKDDLAPKEILLETIFSRAKQLLLLHNNKDEDDINNNNNNNNNSGNIQQQQGSIMITSGDIALLSWSIAKLRYAPDTVLMEGIIKCALSNAKNATMRDIRSMKWALPLLEKNTGISTEDVMELLEERAVELNDGQQQIPAAASPRTN
eukprot:jgi/Bigna1/138098/aug1.43_g12806